MKKRFISKNMIQKTLISIIIVLLLSFAVPVKSQAGIGGILLDPIFDLAGTLFDAVLGGLQMFLVDGEFKTSSDGGLLNPFLVEPDAFVANANGEYDEFIRELRGTTKQIVGYIVIVQPALSRTVPMPDKIQEILAAASSYISRAGKVRGLEIFGSE